MKAIFLLISICVLASCTITKRVHNAGWHVEWKSNRTGDKVQESVAADQSLDVEQTQKESLTEQQQEEALVKSENPNFVGNSIRLDEQDEQVFTSTNSENEFRNSSKLDEDKGRATIEKDDSNVKKVHPLAKAALISLILSVITFGLGALVAFVLALYALKKIKQNPEQWEGRKMAKIVFIIAAILCIPALLVFSFFLWFFYKVFIE
jgi:hypothetical protein